MAEPVIIPNHPLVKHFLASLRDRSTTPQKFRELVWHLSQVLFYEATRDLGVTPTTVETPLSPCPSERLRDRLGLIPVLRAGLGMADAMLDLLPEASVWHLGLYRDHTTLKPVTYYNKFPANHGLDTGYVLDPMLATGGSAVESIHILKRAGVPRIRFIGLIAAPEGIAAVQEAHPDVPLYLAAVDSHLNEVGYIVPGLGDAGDRQFGTA